MLMSELQRVHEYVESGNLRDSQGQYAQALTAYDRALRIDPEDADALFDKGETLEKMGNLMEAQKCYDLALNLYNGY
jgi:tetratricopeptide (TPR) repeat protein